MRGRLIIGCLLGLITVQALARPVSVRGYFRKDGTYVSPHVRSSPNSTTLDNYNPRPPRPSTPYPLVTYPSVSPATTTPPQQFISAPFRPIASKPASYEIESITVFLDVCGGDFRGGTDLLGTGVCTGFVGGISNRDKLAGSARSFCVPDWINASDTLPGIVSYIRQYRTSEWKDAAPAIIQALKDTFPCR